MKKIFMIAAMAMCAMTSSAQHFTAWYGVNLAGVSMEGGSPDNAFKALNIGVSYTAPISEAFEWQVGAGYVTKGCKDWTPGFIQIEGNAAWNFVKKENLKANVFTGPSLGLMVAKDDADEVNAFGFGWQAGVGAQFSCINVKVGYELGFTDMFKDWKSKPNGLFVRVGYTF